MFPVEDARSDYVLEYKHYYLGLPKYTEKECLERRISLSVPLKVRFILNITDENDRKRWGLPEDKFIFGLHQAARKGLHSPILLAAYAQIESDDNYFVLTEEAIHEKAEEIEVNLNRSLSLNKVNILNLQVVGYTKI